MMAFSRTSNSLTYPFAAKVVSTVRTIVHDRDPEKPVAERLHMWEAWPYDGSVHMIPVTYNGDWVAFERQRLIDCGQLEDDIRLHLVQRLWHPTDILGCRGRVAIVPQG